MKITIKFKTLEEAIRAGYGIDSGAKIYIYHNHKDDSWMLVDWSNLPTGGDERMYLALPANSGMDCAWFGESKS